MGRSQSPMAMAAHPQGNISVLTVDGVLDSSTYRQLRDSVIGEALAQPSAVIVDITELNAPAESALSVFTSARWHVSVWPAVPVVLACGHAAGRDALVRNGITRYVPLYPTVEAAAAVQSVNLEPSRNHARAQLPGLHSSLQRARDLLVQSLIGSPVAGLLPVASVVVDVLVENALEHTNGAAGLLVESTGRTVTIAVEDLSLAPAVRHEDAHRGGGSISGLAVVAALTRSWGCIPTRTGKTVWAVLGPENAI